MTNMNSQRSSWTTWILFVAIGLSVAYASGRLTPHLVPDSSSYLDYPFDSIDGIGRAIRTPGYPAWLWVLKAVFGLGFVPAAQVIAHATAVWALFRELSRWELPRRLALAIALPVGIGCTAMDNIHIVSSDALAASLGVLVVVCMLRWIRKGTTLLTMGAITLAATAAICVRPAYLFLIPWLFVAGSLLRSSHPCTISRWQATLSGMQVSVPIATVVFCWMLFRFFAVGDFGILPFGHQNLGGILVQLVSDDELQSLPSGSLAEKMGRAITDERENFARNVGFAEGDEGATMTIDNRWDDMTYFVVVPAAKRVAGNDPVAQHQAIATLNKAIIFDHPIRYAKWIVKAARRGAWAIAADIVMHPVFLVGICVMLTLILFRAVTGGFASAPIADSAGIRAFTILALTYMVMKVGFVILTSPAIGRFSDAAAIFIPGWIAVVFLRLWQGLAKRRADRLPASDA